MEWMARISMALAGLVLLTNVLVEVLKPIAREKIPTNLLVVVISEGITLLFGSVMLARFGVEFTWRMTAGGVVAGLLVAYGAMFGFDKLRQTLEQLAALGKGGGVL